MNSLDVHLHFNGTFYDEFKKDYAEVMKPEAMKSEGGIVSVFIEGEWLCDNEPRAVEMLETETKKGLPCVFIFTTYISKNEDGVSIYVVEYAGYYYK